MQSVEKISHAELLRSERRGLRACDGTMERWPSVMRRCRREPLRACDGAAPRGGRAAQRPNVEFNFRCNTQNLSCPGGAMGLQTCKHRLQGKKGCTSCGRPGATADRITRDDADRRVARRY